MWDHGLGGLLAMDRAVLGGGSLALAGVGLGLTLLLARGGAEPGRGPRVPLILAALLGLGLFSYLTPGDIAGGDAHAHLGRTWLYADAFGRDHVFPVWTNRWYLGYPLGLHYGVLYFATSGLLTALLPFDVFTVTKLLLGSLHVGSALLVFHVVRCTGGSDRAGVVAAAVYAFSFLHLGPVLLSGHLPLSVLFVLLPALWLGLARWERGALGTRSAMALLGLGLAAAIVTHLQYGTFAVVSFGFWLLVRVVWGSRAGTRPAPASGGVTLGIGAVIIAVLLSAWLFVPAWREGGELVHSASSLREELLGDLSLAGVGDAFGLLLWSRKMRDWSYYYLGLVPVALALLAIMPGRRRGGVVPSPGPDGAAPLATLALVSLALCVVQPRFAPFLLLPVALLAGRGAETYFLRGTRRDRGADEEPVRVGRVRFPIARRSAVLAVTLAAVLLLDLGPTLLQSPYRDLDPSDLRGAAQSLAARGDTGRVLVLGSGKSAFWRSLDVVDTGLSTPFGGIPQAATRALLHAATAGSRAAAELVDAGDELSTPTRDALRLLDVDRVVVPGRGAAIEIVGHPAWFAHEIEVADAADPIEELDWYALKERFADRDLDFTVQSGVLERMGLDPAEPRVARIVLHASAPRGLATDGGGGDSPFRLTRHVERHSEVEFGYQADLPGFLLLAYAYSPRLQASIDGRGEVPAYRSATCLTVLPIPAGEHTIVLRATISPLRRVLLMVAAATLLGLLVATFRGDRGRRRQRELPR